MTALLRHEQLWTCPKCSQEAVTTEAQPHTRFHRCAGLHGLTVALVRAGTRCKVEVREREDYVGNERVFLDSRGRPVMSVVTTRDDGSNDVVVFAPTATAKARME